MFNYLKSIWRRVKRWDQPEEHELIKGLFPSQDMVGNSKAGFTLKEKYNKGGEHLVVLTLARKIAAGDLLTFEQISELRSQYNKRARFSTAKEDTMGFINFMLLGGHPTKTFLGLAIFDTTLLNVSGCYPTNE